MSHANSVVNYDTATAECYKVETRLNNVFKRTLLHHLHQIMVLYLALMVSSINGHNISEQMAPS